VSDLGRITTESARSWLHRDRFGSLLDETNPLSLSSTRVEERSSKWPDLHTQILGQFNLGFLICKLGKHLFIIDQHAADEKFRYESNWKNTEVLTQPLLAPLPLELSAADELLLIEHHETFQRNGFLVRVDRAADAGARAKICGIPTAKGVAFGKADVHDLLSLLAEGERNNAIKLPKLSSLFASKACRSSVMIGTSLHIPEMTKLVHQLGTLDQPWNCPHGRPTCRYLTSGP